MSKSYSVSIDGKAYPLKYGVEERELIEGIFPRPDGTPGSLAGMVSGNLVGTGGSIRVQATIVWAGIRGSAPRSVTVDKVREAMSKASLNGGMGEAFLVPARNAILVGGSLGKVVDPDPEPEGKEEGAPPTP